MTIRKRFSGPKRTFAAAAGMAGVLALGVAGCKSNSSTAPIVSNNGQDPADANMAQPYTGGDTGGYNTPAAKTRVLGQSQSYQGQASGESYGDGQQNEAPIIRQAPAGSADQGYTQQGYADGGYTDQGYSDAEEAGAEAIADTDQPPPPLPEYDQPPAPEPNYLWTPGYWNYASAGYYWVPGVWVAPPFYGALWTPPYWSAYGGNRWAYHRGYWGPHVGFYGGVNYGFGYIGTGYYGGYWHGHDFEYNRAVTNVNITVVHNYYNNAVIYNGVHYGPRPQNRVSYDGGRGGLNVQPRPAELAAMHEAHYAPEPAQRQVRLEAANNRGNFFRADGGHPAQAFAARPVGSIGNIAAAPRTEAFNRAGTQPGNRPGAPNGGTPNGFNRPGVPAALNHTGQPNGAPHPGEPNRPEAPHGNPENASRPNQPGAVVNGRPGPGGEDRHGTPGGAPNGGTRPENRPVQPNQPNGGTPNRAAEPNRGALERPGAPSAGRPQFQSRPNGNEARPQFNGNRPDAPQRPQFNGNRPEGAQRPQLNQNHPEATQRPQFNGNRPEVNDRPQFNGNRPEPGGRPQFNGGAGSPGARPAPQSAPAPHPVPESRPAPAAPTPHAAPAPHGGGPGGGGHEGGGHHH